MHTPRLCLDGRAAEEFRFRGLIAQETIDQLVAAGGEPQISSPWLERHRAVMLAHPKQVFSGQLKRFDTRMTIGSTPFHWLWERHFSSQAQVSALHRFRPVDRLFPSSPFFTITTLLPASGGLPVYLPNQEERFVVPSAGDAQTLTRVHGVASEKIHVVNPGVRRYTQFTPALKSLSDGGYLIFLVGARESRSEIKKIVHIITGRFPNLSHKIIRLSDRTDFSPPQWMKLLEKAKLCLYLTRADFDWPLLALEALFWEVPLLFLDGHKTLEALLPHSALALNRFLLDAPEPKQIQTAALAAKASLLEQGVFAPYALARQFRDIYGLIPDSVSAATAPLTSATRCQET